MKALQTIGSVWKITFYELICNLTELYTPPPDYVTDRSEYNTQWKQILNFTTKNPYNTKPVNPFLPCI